MTVDRPYREFWKWFIDNSNAIWNFEENREVVFDLIQEKIKKLHESLTFEIGSIVNSRRDFVISADGIREAFPHVLKLYSLAPQNTDWDFYAFRQRQDPNFSINIGGISVSAEDVYFQLRTNGGLIRIDLYFNLKSGMEEKQLEIIAYLFLDGIIGEYDIETKAGPINVDQLSKHHKNDTLHPIAKLPEAFDNLWTSMFN